MSMDYMSQQRFVFTLIEGLGQKYEFAFCQKCLQELRYLVALSKITSSKPLGFSNFCEVWHR
jgi:hypothetical protein